nr:reverse transcriptase domain-containing protein [Tanacetum cinerariifolium]
MRVLLLCRKRRGRNVAPDKADQYEEVKNKSPGGEKEKSPSRKAWSVHGEILSAIKRSTNKYYVLELYDENEISELNDMKNKEIVEEFINQKRVPTEGDMLFWNINMVAYYKQRKEQESYMGKSIKDKKGRINKEEIDVFDDDSSTAECLNVNEMMGMDMGILSDYTFYNGLTLRHRDTINAAAGRTFMKRRPEECYDLIKNMTAHHNDWKTLARRSESSSSITSSFDTEIAALKAKMAEINKNIMRVLQVNQQVKAVTLNYKTCGGPYSFNDCPATVGNTQNVYAAGAYQCNSYQPQGNCNLLGYRLDNYLGPPGNTITNPNEDLKGITTRSGTAYQGPTIPTTSSFLPPIVECETEATKDTVHPTNNGSTQDVQPLVVQTESPILNSKPVVAPIIEPVASLVSAPKPNQRPLILSCQKTGGPGKFLILCDFPGVAECLALADLGASINLMPLSVWNKLSLPDLSPTCMTLELVDRSISHPVGVVEDVFIKVGTFHFPVDFVVVDFDADPRVPPILERSFLKTERALIDVFEGELTLRIGKEAIKINLDQTSRYSAKYNDMTANRIDVIDMACEEYSQEVLGFFDVIASGNATPYYDPIVSTTSSTLTLFINSDFFLEEVDAFLALEDDPTSPKVDQSYVDTKGDILLLEVFLNDDPSLPPPNKGNYLPQVRKEPKICDDKLPVIIAKDLSVEEKTAFITVLKSHKRAIAWKLSDIKGIDPEFCNHKILMEEDFEPAVQHQRSPWVSPVHCVPKKGGFTVVENEENELILTRLVTGWRVCIDYQKLNEATHKDHFPLPFMDQMLERLAGNEYYCFVDGFSVFRNSFQTCLSHLEKMLKRCEDTNLYLNWEKSHFIVKEGIVLDHKISKNEIEVDKSKVDVISKLPHPITFKGIHSFLGHVGFYRRFIKDFSKIARPMTRIFEKDTPLFFSKECVEAFQTLKRKLTKAPILIAPDWDLPFELMCDASDFAIGAVLGQHQEKHFRSIHYASKTMTKAESNYTTTEEEMLAVVYAFEKFRSYLIMNKSIVYTDHSALKYLFEKKDSKARLLRWVLPL